MFSKALFALTFASTAFATVFVTTPTEATTYTAGQQATVEWKDDGSAPSLAQFGPAKISIYAGNAQQQTLLQSLNTNVDVSQASSITFTPDATIGPNSNEYFIRIESLSLKDASQPTIPALAFSHKFTLAGMTGTFSAAVSSQIAGQSTAPLLASTSAAASAATSAVAATTSAAASTTAAASSSKKASSTASGSAAATHTSAKSSAVGVNAGWIGALLSALVGVTMF